MGEDPNKSAPGSKESSKGRLLDWLDVMAKLVGALAVLLVAIIANSFQGRLTGISIQSQREQAESKLRADMFSSLITPITGSQKDGNPIAPERERLLAQLLALNFYENFEFKPLLEHAAENARTNGMGGNVPGGGPDPREPLWSISRRIAERQRASIAWEWGAANRAKQAKWFHRLFSWGQASEGCEFYTLTVFSTQPTSTELPNRCELPVTLNQTIRLKSPDGNYTLQIAMVHPDWTNQTVNLVVLPFVSAQGSPVETDISYRFVLSWFDFPFTDNTLLPDGNRFAIYLRLISAGPPEKLTVLVVWFPKGYFTPRERPLNYGEVQRLLGTETQ